MHINGPAYLHGAQPLNAPHRAAARSAASETPTPREADQLDISQEADLVSRARDLPEIRSERVARLRSEIAAGTYETDAKLDIALDRLLDEIG